MPRACPVEFQAGRYTKLQITNWMPRACPVEAHALSYSADREHSTGQARGI